MTDRIVPEVVAVYLTFDDAGEVDVTPFVQSGSIKRGRSRELDDFNAGTCTIVLENDSRDFDPPFAGTDDFLTTDDDDFLTTDADDPLTSDTAASLSGGSYGAIRPGQAVRVEFDSVVVFQGHVDDWSHDWEQAEMPTATLSASDALGRLGRRRFTEWTGTDGQRVGARLTAALARPEIDWADSTDFDSGAFNLQADLVAADTNALTYAQLLARTESGRFYASRTNELTYRQASFTSAPSVAVAFRDDENGVDFYGVEVQYGSELWYTEVRVERVGGERQTATSASGTTDLHGGGVIPLPLTGLLMNHDGAAANLADFLLDRYEALEAVIRGLRVDMMRLSSVNAAAVAALDIGSVATVNWTPTSNGDAVIQSLAVEGIEDQFDRATYERYLQMSNAAGTQAFILDDAVFGVLDFSTLGL